MKMTREELLRRWRTAPKAGVVVPPRRVVLCGLCGQLRPVRENCGCKVPVKTR